MKSIIPNCNTCKKSQLDCCCSLEEIEEDEFLTENVDDTLKQLERSEKQIAEVYKYRERNRRYHLRMKDDPVYREKSKNMCKTYYYKNRDVFLYKAHEYYIKNKERISEYCKKRYLKKKMLKESRGY